MSLKPSTRALISAFRPSKTTKGKTLPKSAIGRKGFANSLRSQRRLVGNKTVRKRIISDGHL